jgi:hypothetical protein
MSRRYALKSSREGGEAMLRNAWVLAAASTLLACGGTEVGAAEPLIEHFEVHAEASSALGDRLLRMDLDVTGDGQTELLLAAAGSSEEHWLVYSWQGEKDLHYLGSVDFSYLMFLLTPPPVTLVGTYELGGGRRGVATYQIDTSGIHMISLDDGTDPEATRHSFWDFAEWRQRSNLKVPAVDLAEAERKVQPMWTDQFTGQPVTGLGGLLDVTAVDVSR